jgi:hypothetical protein
MGIVTIVFLIRLVFGLAMVCLLVIAGAVRVHRGPRRAARPQTDAPTNPGQRLSLTQRSIRSAAHSRRLEANDSEAADSRILRRAA